MDTLAEEFSDHFTQSKAECGQHGTDELHYPPHPPDAVVYATSTQEVARIVALCNAHATPVIAFGVGSSVEHTCSRSRVESESTSRARTV